MCRFAAVAALAATALACAADDPNAPLANAKEQLQALKKDEAAQKAGTQNGLKLDTPSLATPASELELPRPRREEEAQRQQQAGRKDWLLEGFDKLDRKRALNAPKRGDAKPGNEALLDPNDPDYFLRLYERQQAEREAKQLKLSGPSASELKTAIADPFAPFMEEWLANSPVRDALRGVADRAAPNDSAPALPGGTASSPTATTARTVTAEPVGAAPAPNPFVQALGLPSLEPARPADTRRPTIDAVNTPSPVPSPSSAKTIYDLPERPKMDLKQALPPPPSEDKKYFPQLKKF